MRFLLDTDVVAEARRPQGSPQVKRWLASTPGRELFLSVLVLGEVRQGVERIRRRDPLQVAAFDARLSRLAAEYADRLVPVTAAVPEEWGRMNVPDPLPAVDSLLAATAKVHGMTLVTRNVADAAATGVALLDPFTPPSS